MIDISMHNKELSTPYFVVDRCVLREGLDKLKEALDKYWGNYIIGYSYKTNALPWVIEFFRDNGCYSEVVSDDEYCLAKSLGSNNIIYNGIAKTKDTYLDALKNHNIVNIDSNYEIEWLDEIVDERCEVGIRVNFDLEKMCPNQTQCGEDGERFGFCYENGELKKAIDRIEKKGHKVVGLHLHKSSKTRMPEIYRAIANVAVEIVSKYKLNIKYIDIGGGFFGGLETKPQFSEYFKMIREILNEQFDSKDTALIVEPGMALIGSPVDYVTKVLDIKTTNRNTFVITDGSRIHIDPLMTKKTYFFDVIRNGGKEERKTIKRQIVSGFTCMEHDRLFEIVDDVELAPGDMIVYHKVGAYTMCLSPLFIKWFPDVYVRGIDDNMFKVRTRWDTEKYKNGSV